MKIVGVCAGVFRTDAGTVRFICKTHQVEGPRRASQDEAAIDLDQHCKGVSGGDLGIIITPKE